MCTRVSALKLLRRMMLPFHPDRQSELGVDVIERLVASVTQSIWLLRATSDLRARRSAPPARVGFVPRTPRPPRR